MAQPLEELALRAKREAFFLGYVLAAYSRCEKLDDTGLADALGCSVEDLVMLRLCRTPRSDGPGFRDDIRAISTRFKLDSTKFATIVKRGRVVDRFETAADRDKECFMAARDREPEEDNP